MNRYLGFTSQAVKVIDSAFDKAEEIFGDCKFNQVRVGAGNTASYGDYIAHYFPHGQYIEFPVANHFSPLEITADGIEVTNEERLFGIMLHELGHHIEISHDPAAWAHIKTGKSSTHGRPSWAWVVGIYWNHFFPEYGITPENIAFALRRKIITAETLATWEPNRTPPDRLRAGNIYAATTIECGTCGTLFRPARKTAQFCSTKCRVAAHRLAA